jgi:hypothetical protein
MQRSLFHCQHARLLLLTTGCRVHQKTSRVRRASHGTRRFDSLVRPMICNSLARDGANARVTMRFWVCLVETARQWFVVEAGSKPAPKVDRAIARIGYTQSENRLRKCRTEGVLPLPSLRSAAMASSSFSRCPTAVTPSSFRVSCVRLGRTVSSSSFSRKPAHTSRGPGSAARPQCP